MQKFAFENEIWLFRKTISEAAQNPAVNGQRLSVLEEQLMPLIVSIWNIWFDTFSLISSVWILFDSLNSICLLAG